MAEVINTDSLSVHDKTCHGNTDVITTEDCMDAEAELVKYKLEKSRYQSDWTKVVQSKLEALMNRTSETIEMAFQDLKTLFIHGEIKEIEAVENVSGTSCSNADNQKEPSEEIMNLIDKDTTDLTVKFI